jgi:hypothetical protein
VQCVRAFADRAHRNDYYKLSCYSIAEGKGGRTCASGAENPDQRDTDGPEPLCGRHPVLNLSSPAEQECGPRDEQHPNKTQYWHDSP